MSSSPGTPATEQMKERATYLRVVLVLEQGLGLLLADDGPASHGAGSCTAFSFPPHQQAHGGRELGLGLQDLRASR